MAITPLPTPPSSADPANFSTRADAFLTALPAFATECNATAVAMNLNATNATSTASLLIGLGSKSLNVEANKSYVVGMTVKISSTASPTNWMLGDVTSYTTGTGALVVNVLYSGGSGTLTPWTISQSVAVSGSAQLNDLLIGATSNPSGAKLLVAGTVGVAQSGGVAGIRSITAGDSAYPVLTVNKFDNIATTSQVFIQFTINNVANGGGQINGNGVNAAAFGAYSDSRLKENITNLPSQLNNILALRPVEFDYIASEGGGHQIGFIAQEVKEIYPDLVGERADGMFTLSDMNKNDARLIKAIQELKTIIDTQQARITALEARV